MKPLAAAFVALHANCRVARDHSDVDGEVEQHAQDLQKVVTRLRRVALSADDALDVLAREPRYRLIAMRVTEALDDIPSHRRGAGLEATEVGRAVIAHGEGIDRTG